MRDSSRPVCLWTSRERAPQWRVIATLFNTLQHHFGSGIKQESLPLRCSSQFSDAPFLFSTFHDTCSITVYRSGSHSKDISSGGWTCKTTHTDIQYPKSEPEATYSTLNSYPRWPTRVSCRFFSTSSPSSSTTPTSSTNPLPFFLSQARMTELSDSKLQERQETYENWVPCYAGVRGRRKGVDFALYSGEVFL